MGGIPPLGGPPERISLYGTECLLKSVVNSLSAPRGGDSAGREGKAGWVESGAGESDAVIVA